MHDWLASLNIHIENPWLLGVVKSGIILAGLFACLTMGLRIINLAVRRIFTVTHVQINTRILDTVDDLFKKVLVLVAAGYIAESFPLHPRLMDLANGGIFIAIIYLVLISIFDLANESEGYLHSLGAKEFQPLVSKIFKIVISLIAIMVVMRHFNYDIWHIVGALGIGSLAIGLAAQPVLSNMIAGFTLLIDHPFRPGDRILLTGNDMGDVIQIGMRSTRIRTTDGNMLIVPNSELVNSRVVNFNFPSSATTQKIKIYVDPESDLHSVKTLLQEAVDKLPGVSHGSVTTYATNINDWGIELTLQFNVDHFSEAPAVVDRVIEFGLKSLRERHIKIATNPILARLKT